MTLYKSVLMGALVSLVLAGHAPAVSAAMQAATRDTTKVDDSTLQSRIVVKIKKNATLAARELDVNVQNGIVTLKGTVRTAEEKAQAARLATINGVDELHNEIVVDAKTAKGSADDVLDATKRAGGKAAEATKSAAQKTAEKARQVVSATGEAISDGWITTKVRAKFSDTTSLKGSDIDVTTTNRVVTLKGTVASSATRTKAAEIASDTDGVTRVVNRLVVVTD